MQKARDLKLLMGRIIAIASGETKVPGMEKKRGKAVETQDDLGLSWWGEGGSSGSGN